MEVLGPVDGSTDVALTGVFEGVEVSEGSRRGRRRYGDALGVRIWKN